MAKYEVEFWPGQVVQVEIDDAFSEDTALVKAVMENGWVGGEEATGDGKRFMAWVRKVEK